MDKLLYNDYVKRLSDKIATQFNAIEAGYNFDFGPELEVALCHVLSECLPQKYGVCRGYVVDAEGNLRGDDILIFAQDRFFTLRQGIGLDFTVKEQIPIEAAISYVEAKHTIILEGDSGSSLYTACKQVEKVKSLCAKRDPVKLGSWDPYVDSPIEYPTPEGFSIRNPMYGVIFARNVRLRENSKNDLSPNDIDAIIQERIPKIITDRSHAPDLIVAGNSNVVTPAISKKGSSFYVPFMSQVTNYGTRVVPGLAYGIGFTCLQFALDWIRLGKLPWDRILANALDIKRVENGPGSPVKQPTDT